MTERVPWWNTELGGAEVLHHLSEAVRGRRISLGPLTGELEARLARFLDVPFVVVTPSGTAALAMALLAVGVGPGDEVIVPDLTWIATANAAAVLGAKVVLADCLPDLPLIDPEQVRSKLTSRTRAILPVHANGRPCDMAELLRIAAEHGLAVIEDACKALGSRGSGGMLGTGGRLGCFSLGMVSLVTMGYGGAVVTRDPDLHRKLRAIRAQGVPDLQHEAYVTLGFNFKVSDLLSALGLAQMEGLEGKVAHLHKVYGAYVEGLADHPSVRLIPVDREAGQLPLLVEARSPHRDAILSHLRSEGVEARPFHLPLHEAAYLGNPGAFPNATRFAREGFILPCGPAQPLSHVHRALELIRAWRPEPQRTDVVVDPLC